MYRLYVATGNATLLLVGCCVSLGIALSLLCLYALDK